MQYRADIQFMRAVAVTLVILYHLGAPVHAGFIGVDVFFVISGFLMQKLYKAEDGPSGFYIRRAKRLLPAYYTAILATLVGAFFITLPTDFGQVVTQAVYASLFSSNIGFWSQSSYFNKAEFNPMLHLWSLGVELQFYLIFPMLWLLGRRYKIAIPLILILSMIACLFVVTISPKTSFFMMPLRLWQFAAGMLVARYAPTDPRGGWIGLCALASILVLAFLPIDGTALSVINGHPGLGAIGATFLTAAILWLGLPVQLIKSAIGRAGERIGDISYSLYLAHFPVIVLLSYQPFSGTRLGNGTVVLPLAATAIFMVASIALYRWVERNGPRFVNWKNCALASALLIGVALAMPLVQDMRFSRADRLIFAAWADRATYRCGKMARILSPTSTTCDLSSGPKGQIFLVGDSHADAIKSTLVTVAARHGYGVRFAVTKAALMDPRFGAKWLKREISRPEVQGAILHYAIRDIDAELVTAAEEALKGSKYVFILPAPEYTKHVPATIYRMRHGSRESLVREDGSSAIGLVKAHLRNVVDPTPAFCERGKCSVVNPDGALLYFDGDHLTLTGARRLEPLFENMLQRW